MSKKNQAPKPEQDELQRNAPAQEDAMAKDEPELGANVADAAETDDEQDLEQGNGPTDQLVKVRILVDCQIGKCNDVVEVKESDLTGLAGQVDADPAAVAYAESLSE